jgi:predicted branched-subunit amino acid permease
MTNTQLSMADGAKAALPIALGYFPIAFSFGVAATRVGLSLTEAMALALIIFSGAAQFLAVALIASGVPALLAAATMVAMNLRHVFYGPVLMRHAGKDAARTYAFAWAFGLTDEVFGAALGALSKGGRFSEPFMSSLAFLCYASWGLGTLAGGWAGAGALDRWPAVAGALGFMLSALFLSLLMAMMSARQIPLIAAACLATWVGTQLGSVTIGLFAGMGAGAVLGVLMPGGRDAK